ncbi:hypothetical protein TD95_001349 [Thielaviopsis punctulata]|uniref:Succinate dehydrogenase assembly factor 4, mitochondrial n=1 Tax=Thielaviopsis punctulata TaxID=72032 RepID=A0A0F4ZHM0_9PEZI|nr:hypothetical protein TD95_001349 [Thielaviopsis punctulata]
MSHLLRLLRPQTRLSSTLRPLPGPPRLPASEQAEFERLQRLAASALTNPNLAAALAEASGDASVAEGVDMTSVEASNAAKQQQENEDSGGIFRGAKPEFEGDTNPKTGEVGGPKNEPLRWGGNSDWSFNGRATDF